MSKTPKKSKRQMIEDWLSENYQIQYNEIRKTIEWRQKNSNDPEFYEIDDFTLNTMVSAMDRDVFFTPSAQTIFSIVMSDYVRFYNPIKEYFTDLKGSFEEENLTITKMANCVKFNDVRETVAFRETLKRWMVASVANALNSTGCQNHHCIVLTGDQGAFKTTYINTLFPKGLKKYCFTGKIRLEEKDTFLMLGQFFIINLDDQLRKLHKKDSETMKTLITQPDFYERLPYGKLPTHISRIANIIGSINGNEFLSDTTGNRRFLPFEVKSIDIDQAQSIDIDQAWFEAYTLYKNKFKYWFDREELEMYFGQFENYITMTPEEELFYKYFEPLTKDMARDIRFKKMQTTDIVVLLKAFTQNRLDVNSKIMGELLKNKIKPETCTWAGKRGFWIRERSPDEIENKEEVPF
jgi:predicted P-loop ATPase